MSKAAHVIALTLAAATAFLASPAGQALTKQYPLLMPIATGIGIALTYLNPKKGA